MLCLFILTAIFFIGRFSVKEKIITEIKTIKVTDAQAVKKAVLEERKKNNSKFVQKKVRDTTKLPDGTIKTHEEIANVLVSEETSQILKKTDLDIRVREVEKIELKTPLKNLAFELGGQVQNPISNFSTLPSLEPDFKFDGKLDYRVGDNFWTHAGVGYSFLNSKTYVEAGVKFRVEF
ncbi:hypothetical protein [Silvanigrella sp.]|jgi:hypothetical protein|uniref:hypothetical protein n=1 Tax=Silvanigrella sp. TaxID=2024976 RepID=UPI0037C66F50